jgi:hypothetical protein
MIASPQPPFEGGQGPELGLPIIPNPAIETLPLVHGCDGPCPPVDIGRISLLSGETEPYVVRIRTHDEDFNFVLRHVISPPAPVPNSELTGGVRPHAQEPLIIVGGQRIRLDSTMALEPKRP